MHKDSEKSDKWLYMKGSMLLLYVVLNMFAAVIQVKDSVEPNEVATGSTF